MGDAPCSELIFTGHEWSCPGRRGIEPCVDKGCTPALSSHQRLTHARPELECDSPRVGRVYPRDLAYGRHSPALLGCIPAASRAAGQGRARLLDVLGELVSYSEVFRALVLPEHPQAHSTAGFCSPHCLGSWKRFSCLASGAGLCSTLRRPLGHGMGGGMQP